MALAALSPAASALWGASTATCRRREISSRLVMTHYSRCCPSSCLAQPADYRSAYAVAGGHIAAMRFNAATAVTTQPHSPEAWPGQVMLTVVAPRRSSMRMPRRATSGVEASDNATKSKVSGAVPASSRACRSHSCRCQAGTGFALRSCHCATRVAEAPGLPAFVSNLLPQLRRMFPNSSARLPSPCCQAPGQLPIHNVSAPPTVRVNKRVVGQGGHESTGSPSA